MVNNTIRPWLVVVVVLSFVTIALRLATTGQPAFIREKLKTKAASMESLEPRGSGPGEPLPGWIRRYAAWHRRKKDEFFGAEGGGGASNSSSDAKFLVMACQEDTNCGGLTDRMRGLLYWLRQAERSNRVLLIHWTKGYSLEHFWVPPVQGLDWVLPNASSGDEFWSCIRDKRKNLDLTDVPKQLSAGRRVACVKTQNFLNSEAIKSNFYAAENETITAGTFSRIYGLMFEPSTELQRYIRNSIGGMGLTPESFFLSAQIRSMYPLKKEGPGIVRGLVRPNLNSHPELIQSWAKHAVRSVVAAYKESTGNDDSGGVADRLVVYVTADNPRVVEYLKSTNAKEGNSTVAAASGNDADEDWPLIVGLESMERKNIEFAKPQRPSDLFPTFLDLWLMSHSKCVSYGIGGYGRFGADLAGTGCMVQHRSSRYWCDYDDC